MLDPPAAADTNHSTAPAACAAVIYRATARSRKRASNATALAARVPATPATGGTGTRTGALPATSTHTSSAATTAASSVLLAARFRIWTSLDRQMLPRQQRVTATWSRYHHSLQLEIDANYHTAYN